MTNAHNPQPWQMQTLEGELAGLRFAGSDAGILRVALHGWLDNAASMSALLQALAIAGGGPALALDLPGHGLSFHPRHHAPFVDYLDTLLQVLNAQTTQAVDLIGHSMGGAIAVLFAAAFPEKIRRLVLIDSIGPLSAPEARFASDLRAGLLARHSAKRRGRYSNFEAALDAREGALGITRAQALPIVERGLARVDLDGAQSWQWRSDPRLTQPSPTRLSEAQVLQAISALSMPCLLVLAEPRTAFLDNALGQGRLAAFHAAGAAIRYLAGNHHLHVLPDVALVELVQTFLS